MKSDDATRELLAALEVLERLRPYAGDERPEMQSFARAWTVAKLRAERLADAYVEASKNGKLPTGVAGPVFPDAELAALKDEVVAAADPLEAREQALCAIERFERSHGPCAEVRRLYAMCWTPKPPAVARVGGAP